MYSRISIILGMKHVSAINSIDMLKIGNLLTENFTFKQINSLLVLKKIQQQQQKHGTSSNRISSSMIDSVAFVAHINDIASGRRP